MLGSWGLIFKQNQRYLGSVELCGAPDLPWCLSVAMKHSQVCIPGAAAEVGLLGDSCALIVHYLVQEQLLFLCRPPRECSWYSCSPERKRNRGHHCYT